MSYATEDDLETNAVNAKRPEVSIGFAPGTVFLTMPAHVDRPQITVIKITIPAHTTMNWHNFFKTIRLKSGQSQEVRKS